jgi:hypothetical protein
VRAIGSHARLSGVSWPVVIGRSQTLLAAVLLSLALYACGASAHSAPRAGAEVSPVPNASAKPCGAGAPATAARAAGTVAERIYGLEVSSAEVQADRRQVEGYAPLLAAMASGSRAAAVEAVNHLVFSGTHIVRLRVSRGGAVLADVGGPYILAPASGNLRLHGRSVGRYVFSVQDDLGYVKLESRFIGAPLMLRQGARRIPLEGTIAPGSATIPDAGPFVYRGSSYEAFSFNAQAFPTGPLRITLLVAAPRSSALSCAAVKAAELGRVAQTVWHRFTVLGAPVSSYVRTLHGLTDGLIYVRSGSRQLAGSTQPGPSRLPSAGPIRYRGTSFRVTSFAASVSGASARVYQLVASQA